MSISTRQLKNFVTVLETASFLKASEILNVTQPALSKSIRVLEQYYGVTLFDRLPRGVKPTAFASILEKYARRILADESGARDELLDIVNGGHGHVNVGIGRPFAELVNDTITEIHEHRPNVEFRITTAFADELGKLLLNNRIDLMLAMYNGVQQSDVKGELVFHKWFSDRFIGVCPKGHPLEGKLASVKQLTSIDFAFPSIEHTAHNALQVLFSTHGVERPRAAITTNSNEIIISAVKDNGMISVVSEFAALTRGFRELGQFEIKGFNFTRNVGIVHRKDMLKLPLHDDFILALRARSDEFVRSSSGSRLID